MSKVAKPCVNQTDWRRAAAIATCPSSSDRPHRVYRALSAVVKQAGEGILAVEPLEQSMHHILREAGIERIDYACIVDRTTLESLPQLDRPAVALIAAHVGDTRLIDNVLL
ncbi:MAG: pantoate--beta-alanine ligase [Pirellulaceae bacterium]